MLTNVLQSAKCLFKHCSRYFCGANRLKLIEAFRSKECLRGILRPCCWSGDKTVQVYVLVSSNLCVHHVLPSKHRNVSCVLYRRICKCSAEQVALCFTALQFSMQMLSTQVSADISIQCLRGHAVTQLVDALRYEPEGQGFASRWCLWEFSFT